MTLAAFVFTGCSKEPGDKNPGEEQIKYVKRVAFSGGDTYTFTYDNKNRVVEIKTIDGNYQNRTTLTYTSDTEVKANYYYTYDNTEQSSGYSDCTLDANGNLIALSAYTSAYNGTFTSTYTWDNLGRLTNIESTKKQDGYMKFWYTGNSCNVDSLSTNFYHSSVGSVDVINEEAFYDNKKNPLHNVKNAFLLYFYYFEFTVPEYLFLSENNLTGIKMTLANQSVENFTLTYTYDDDGYPLSGSSGGQTGIVYEYN